MKQIEKKRRGWRSAIRAVLVGVAFLSGVAGSTGPATAQNAIDWRPYFSEEGDGKTQCPASMGGVRCQGGWCDNVSVACSAPGVVPLTEGSWGEWFSEEGPNNTYFCPRGTMATGMKCRGGNCDDVSLFCAPTDVTVSNCRWTGWVSEEAPNNQLSFPNQIMTGMECRGGYCDEKRAHICDYAKPTTVVGQPRGDWSVACSGGQGCTSAVTESLNIGSLDEKKWNSQTQLSLSSTIETGVSYGGVSASTSLTAGFQQTLGQAARIAKSTDRKYQRSCQQTLDFTKYDISTVWQYEITTPVAGTNVTISTCTITCTPDGNKPTYLPGSPEDIGSCLRLRNAATRAATPASTSAPAATGGFFRQNGQAPVYWQFSQNAYCQVQNQAQMEAYGGFGQVNVVPQLQLSGASTGACGWPNGFYRRAGELTVYRMHGTSSIPNLGSDICNVINEAQMASFGGFGVVKVVSDDSDLNRGRNAVTACAL